LANAEVLVLKTADRTAGIRVLLEKIGMQDYKDKTVAVKANFNSADPFPASTHLDTLRGIIEGLKGASAGEITLGERSGMGDTREVLEQMGVFKLAQELGFKTVVLDELGKTGWVKFEHEGTHWLRGFFMAKMFHDAEKIVQTCCIKTHRYGGHFTLSMKNSVGMVAKRVPIGLYDYMWELHSSPFQRHMIAEINSRYSLDFVIMDGIKAFTSGGPENGTLVEPNLLLASRDRVAIDAVGVSILKMYGAKGKVGNEPVFEQDQLKRAAELGFGVKSADEIRLVAVNSEAQGDVEHIESVLKAPVAVH
jgi:uncharacterized protein (DUF362 family)